MNYTVDFLKVKCVFARDSYVHEINATYLTHRKEMIQVKGRSHDIELPTMLRDQGENLSMIIQIYEIVQNSIKGTSDCIQQAQKWHTTKSIQHFIRVCERGKKENALI